jgi:hypothetical protein
MRPHAGEGWPVRVDGGAGHGPGPRATLRRVGWLDQEGRVWLEVPPGAGSGGGPLTPLLVDAREPG